MATLQQGIIPAPPGVTPNFDNPVSQARSMVVACIIPPSSRLYALLSLVLVEFIEEAELYKVFSITLSAVSIICKPDLKHPFASCFLLIAPPAADRYGVGKHAWDVRVELLTPFLKYAYAQSLVYDLGIYLAKLSILILFYRVFGVNQRFRWAVYTVTAMWTMYTIANTLLIIFACTPVHKAWHPLTEGRCMSLVNIAVAGGYFNIITDFLILFMPVPMVWSLHLPEKMKLAVVGIFATATFACVTAIIRQVEIVKAQPNTDATWLNSNSLLWLTIELNTGIICGCMTTLKPLLRRTVWRADRDSRLLNNYEYRGRSSLKSPSHGRPIGDGLMDASYIELGPPGTNRDVRIAAENSGAAKAWHGHGNGAIVKTETFGQDVTYEDRGE
ncbi:MAG: hypothetical protein Q9188_002687 [Gyalolechia gomerana]